MLAFAKSSRVLILHSGLVNAGKREKSEKSQREEGSQKGSRERKKKRQM